ncbi:hypothetical protein RND71_038249 [Anisodus tanguticus]|uniref:AMP-dependent synthetase/ligase domain-containing protein n=1 Tax=Anisodus tanguticus TaxID=243964 RepID=A0AAE1QZL5_9SOLA|nr:hypothetical protein RND71_038249 [Anisodus tanguticus]
MNELLNSPPSCVAWAPKSTAQVIEEFNLSNDKSCAYRKKKSIHPRLKRKSKHVATLAPNVPAMQELYFAVPMAEAVLCTLNIRLDSSIVADLLKHSEANIIFVDQQLLQIAQGALKEKQTHNFSIQDRVS